MKLDLDQQDIGNSELLIEGVLELGLSDGRPPHADVRGTLCVENMESRLLVTGTISATGKADCARCMSEFSLDWEVPVEIIVLRKVDPDEGQGETLVVCQAGGVVDLESPLREWLVLGYPQAPICRPDCKGLCAQCGLDLNENACDCTELEIDPRWDGLPDE